MSGASELESTRRARTITLPMTFRPVHRRRLVPIFGLLTVIAFLAASLGVVPSPLMVAGWFGVVWSSPYPCQDHACGCASAHECWTECCCHTEHERLVWAIEHGVLPPAGVTFTDEQWIAAANAVRPGSAHCSLCVEALKKSLARGIAIHGESTGDHPRVVASCCGESRSCDEPALGATTKAGSCCETSSSAHASEAKGAPARWGMSALSCKGKNVLLAVGFPSLPRVAGMGDLLPAPEFSEPITAIDEHAASRPLDPTVPPPRA